MKKSQLLTAMGFLTLFGVAMVAAGLASLSQLPDSTLTQAWSELWTQHQAFAWVMTIYCSVMLAFDVVVISGILFQSSEKTLPVNS